MKRLLLAILFLCAPAWGYQYCAMLTPTGSTSGTLTDFTETFTGNDPLFKAAPTGAIQHTTTLNGVTVPIDFVLTTTAGCTAITGSLTWDFEAGGTVDGKPILNVKFPSLTTSPSNIYVAIGDTGVTTWQGGAPPYDSNTQGVWHFPDGSSLSLVDFSANSATNGGTGINTPTAASGKIDGGAGLASASNQYITVGTSTTLNPAAETVSAWVNASSFPQAYNTIWSRINTASTSLQQLFVKSNGKLAIYLQGTGAVNYDGTGSTTLSTGTWYHIAFTYSSTAGLIGYVNGSSDHTAAANGLLASSAGVTASIGQDIKAGARLWNGVIDEVKVSSEARSASWIATEYANQSSPPAIGPFTAITALSNSQTQIF